MSPRGPYPILIVNGEQGSAKSSLTKMLRILFDANIAPPARHAERRSDLLVGAMHSHVLAAR